MEVRPREDWNSTDLANAGGINERWATRGQLAAEGRPHEDTEPEAFDRRPGRDYDHACAHAWFDSEEVRTVHRTVGTPDVVDAGRVQCAGAVAVHIHADLDDPHELHEVHDRLPKPVSVPDDHLRRCRI